jgi:hypothetical protein
VATPDGRVGYIAAAGIQPTATPLERITPGPSPGGRTGAASPGTAAGAVSGRTAGAALLAAPADDAALVTTAAAGEPLAVLGRHGAFVLVRNGAGREAWMREDALSGGPGGE